MSDAIATVVLAPLEDLGGDFKVRRALPTTRRHLVGPFVFLDPMGPVRFARGWTSGRNRTSASRP